MPFRLRQMPPISRHDEETFDEEYPDSLWRAEASSYGHQVQFIELQIVRRTPQGAWICRKYEFDWDEPRLRWISDTGRQWNTTKRAAFKHLVARSVSRVKHTRRRYIQAVQRREMLLELAAKHEGKEHPPLVSEHNPLFRSRRHLDWIANGIRD